MCRFTVYKGRPMVLADLVTRPSRSIIMQSYHCQERLPGLGSSFNADGFGVGWYTVDEQGESRPCMFKSDRPAWSNQNLKNISLTITSPIIFAHVRAATLSSGIVSETNCHPFLYGNMLWMHNGHIGGFLKVRRRMVESLPDHLFHFVKGTTDAEMAFAVFLAKLGPKLERHTCKDMVIAMQETLRCICEWCDEAGVTEGSLLNFAVSDGEALVATRFCHNADCASSLYFASGTTFECRNGDYEMETSHMRETSIIVSSEPLTDKAWDWVVIPPNHMVVHTADCTVLLLPCFADALDKAPVLAGSCPMMEAAGLIPSVAHLGASHLAASGKLRTAQDEVHSGGRLPPCLMHAPEQRRKCVSRSAEHHAGPTPTSPTQSDPTITPLQTLTGHLDEVLCTAVDNATNQLFTGSLDCTIRVWSLLTCQQVAVLNAPTAVLCLEVMEEQAWLFVMCASTQLQIYSYVDQVVLLSTLAAPYSKSFCMKVVEDVLYCGGLDTNLHYVHLDHLVEQDSDGEPVPRPQEVSVHAHWHSSPAHCGVIYAMHLILLDLESSRRTAVRPTSFSRHSDAFRPFLNVSDDSLLNRRLSVEPQKGALGTQVLLTASGDGLVKAWAANDQRVFATLLHTYRGHTAAVMDLAGGADGEAVFYSASADHTVKVWDAYSEACLHSLQHAKPMCKVVAEQRLMICVDVTGMVEVWSRYPHTLLTWYSSTCPPKRHKRDNEPAVPEPPLTFFTLNHSTDFLITAHKGPEKGSTGFIRLWDLGAIEHVVGAATAGGSSNRSMISLLSTFISFKSINSPQYTKDCYNTAFFLKGVIERLLPCHVKVVKTDPKHMPVVFAKINAGQPHRPTVLVYGHYDVVDVSLRGEWDTDPFEMEGRDGYYYGRGTTDNKGPIMAAIHAIYELIEEGKAAADDGSGLSCFPVNVILIYEGAQETDSAGLLESCAQMKPWFDAVDPANTTMLICNTYWLGDRVPCLVYGLRGLLQLVVEVTGPAHDLHSGIDGGIIQEPMADLIQLLSSLMEKDGRCAVPGFYDDIAELTADEEALFARLDSDFNTSAYLESRGVTKLKGQFQDGAAPTDVLRQRWCQPSLTVHNIQSSVQEMSLIPHKVEAQLSIRLVHRQSGERIADALQDFLFDKFDQLGTSNELAISVRKVVDPWRVDPRNKFYQAAECAIRDVWKQEPLYIQEGGNVNNPLMKFFPTAPTLHLPLGQASDRAHLSNERIRWENLVKGKNVLKAFFQHLGNAAGPAA
eukprot:EG_transcript_716